MTIQQEISNLEAKLSTLKEKLYVTKEKKDAVKAANFRKKYVALQKRCEKVYLFEDKELTIEVKFEFNGINHLKVKSFKVTSSNSILRKIFERGLLSPEYICFSIGLLSKIPALSSVNAIGRSLYVDVNRFCDQYAIFRRDTNMTIDFKNILDS